jgi:hypothetical protein
MALKSWVAGFCEALVNIDFLGHDTSQQCDCMGVLSNWQQDSFALLPGDDVMTARSIVEIVITLGSTWIEEIMEVST